MGEGQTTSGPGCREISSTLKPWSIIRPGEDANLETSFMQPSRSRKVRVRHSWQLLAVGLAWSLSLPFASDAYAGPSGSPSNILEKGQWEMGVAGGGLWKRAMKNGAKVSVYEGAHTRGYGLTHRVTFYGTIGGAYIGNDDPSIATDVKSSFGANLVLGGQLNANLWKTATGSWEWDGSFGYLYMGAPHKRKGNQASWNEWQCATSIATSLGNFKPYAGIKLSVLRVDYQLRTATVTTHGRYQPKDIVGPLFGIDWSFGEEKTTVLNLEGSYIGGAEVNLVLTEKF